MSWLSFVACTLFPWNFMVVGNVYAKNGLAYTGSCLYTKQLATHKQWPATTGHVQPWFITGSHNPDTPQFLVFLWLQPAPGSRSEFLSIKTASLLSQSHEQLSWRSGITTISGCWCYADLWPSWRIRDQDLWPSWRIGNYLSEAGIGKLGLNFMLVRQ